MTGDCSADLNDWYTTPDASSARANTGGNVTRDEVVADVRRALRALYLETPKAVAHDVNAKVERLIALLAAAPEPRAPDPEEESAKYWSERAAAYPLTDTPQPAPDGDAVAEYERLKDRFLFYRDRTPIDEAAETALDAFVLPLLAQPAAPEPREPDALPQQAVWDCKIGGVDREKLPPGSDYPLRQAVEEAYKRLTGEESRFCFSGWAGLLTPTQQEVVNEIIGAAPIERSAGQ